MRLKSDFVVETNHLCFVCLKHAGTSPQIKDFIKQESKSQAIKPDSPHFPIYSLKSLSRFLGMDMKKVFKNQQEVSPHLLIKVEQAALKAELCDNCSVFLEKFSQLHQNFEKIRIELMYCLRDIQEQFIEVNDEGVTEEQLKVAQGQEYSTSNPNNGWSDKLHIFKILRTQAIEISSRLTSSSAPRIKVENLTRKGVTLKKVKLKQNSALHAGPSQPVVIEIIKKEFPTGSSSSRDRDSDCDMDYSNNMEIHDDDLPGSDASGMSPIVAEIKADVRNLGKSDTPTHQHGPHKSEPTKKTKLAAPPTRPSPKLSMTSNYCIICVKEFASQKDYNLHHQAVHTRPERKCKGCNKLFATSQNLERHQRMRSCVPIAPKYGVGRHRCKLCDKSYCTRYHLNVHVDTVHLRTPRHKCGQCGRVFNYTSNLQAHIKLVHQGIRAHCCNVCPKRYASKSSLKDHKIKAHASGSIPP